MASGDTKTEAMLNTLGNGGNADEFRGCCNTKTQQYILDAIDRVQNVEDEVEELKNNPDVVDIVDTYADLQAYDTSKLTDKDIIRVLTDETHGGNSTYYRFTKSSNTWTFIGEIAGGGVTELTSADYDYPDGTPTAVALWKLDPGMYYADTGVALRPSTNNFVISDAATVFVGADSGGGNNVFRQILIIEGSGADIQLYYVKPDGTYGSDDRLLIGTRVQTPGSSSSSIMSQNAVTEMVFADPASRTKIRIGNTNNGGTNSISIGGSGQANGKNAIQIGSAQAYSDFSICFSSGYSYATDGIAIGRSSGVAGGNNRSVALGSYSKTTRAGEVNIGTGTDNYGYNSTKYRVLGGVHDGQNAHDAATVAQGNTLATSAPTTSTVGVLGQLYTDTTSMHTYQCTAISGDTYTWQMRW